MRLEAQKNIDQRLKAEQDLNKIKSERGSMGDTYQQKSSAYSSSSQRDGPGSRRGIMGLSNYEKMFFGTPQQNPSQINLPL